MGVALDPVGGRVAALVVRRSATDPARLAWEVVIDLAPIDLGGERLRGSLVFDRIPWASGDWRELSIRGLEREAGGEAQCALFLEPEGVECDPILAEHAHLSLAHDRPGYLRVALELDIGAAEPGLGERLSIDVALPFSGVVLHPGHLTPFPEDAETAHALVASL
ncbi:MAG: hypothetical protein R3B82_30435, partial [Sandaracinaceae bacterium]